MLVISDYCFLYLSNLIAEFVYAIASADLLWLLLIYEQSVVCVLVMGVSPT